jgi:hypothetical protein
MFFIENRRGLSFSSVNEFSILSINRLSLAILPEAVCK